MLVGDLDEDILPKAWALRLASSIQDELLGGVNAHPDQMPYHPYFWLGRT